MSPAPVIVCLILLYAADAKTNEGKKCHRQVMIWDSSHSRRYIYYNVRNIMTYCYVHDQVDGCASTRLGKKIIKRIASIRLQCIGMIIKIICNHRVIVIERESICLQNLRCTVYMYIILLYCIIYTIIMQSAYKIRGRKYRTDSINIYIILLGFFLDDDSVTPLETAYYYILLCAVAAGVNKQ